MKLWVLLCLLACLTPLTARQQDVDTDDNEFAEFEDEGKLFSQIYFFLSGSFL